MKKLIGVSIMSLLMMSLIGCPTDGGGGGGSTSNNGNATTTKVVAEKYRGTWKSYESVDGVYLFITLTENKATRSIPKDGLTEYYQSVWTEKNGEYDCLLSGTGVGGDRLGQFQSDTEFVVPDNFFFTHGYSAIFYKE